MREHGDSPRPIGSCAGDPFDVALFLLSGGTTGMPKLIPRTHTDYLYNARESAVATGLTTGLPHPDCSSQLSTTFRWRAPDCSARC